MNLFVIQNSNFDAVSFLLAFWKLQVVDFQTIKCDPSKSFNNF